jgi:tetratricopeptide (TPR) repeat protein
MCHAELGRFAEGRVLGEAGLQLAEVVAHPGSLMFASYAVGLLSLRQGDLPRALPCLERAVSLRQDADLPIYFTWVAAALGAAYTLSGRVVDAVALLTQTMDQRATMENVLEQVLCRLSLGEAHLRSSHLEEAHALTEHTLTLAQTHQERSHQAYALCLLGEIAAQREPTEVVQAEEYFRQALTLADELGMRPLQAHCHLGLGTLYCKISQREEAHTELVRAIEMYRAMDMTFWLPQVEAVLAQVEEW